MKTLRRVLLAVLATALLGFAAVWLGFHWHPSLARYQALALPAAPAQPGALRVTWLGVSTLLFSDGETAWLTDGFFSRPGPLQTGLGQVAPDPAAVQAALARAGVQRLAAVVALHSHYDHAMDSPLVAQLTGARLVGSESTANVARGQGFDMAQFQTLAAEGGSLVLGRFKLRLIASVHAPEDHFPGQITAPLVPPSAASAYRTGAAYSLLVEHNGKTLLVQASAGYVPGALAGVKADTVLLGIGLLGKQDAAFRQAYWREVVQTTGAKRVLPIHWDDFFQPLGPEPVQALPWLADRIPASLDFVQSQAASEQRSVGLPQAFVPFNPF